MKPKPPAQIGERRYTEEELALILNRAAERQEGVQANAPRYTLAEIQEIAAGAGIAPEHVASVATTLRDARAPRGGGLLGAPDRFRFEETIDGEVADDVIDDLFDLVRRALELQGAVTEALGTVEWKGQDAFGTTYVTVARRGGRTTISILNWRSDAAVASVTFAGMGAIFGSGGLTVALGSIASLAEPLAVIAGIGLGTTSVWAALRATWRRYARRVVARTESLGSALVAAARQAVEEGRTVRSGDPARE
jgi:hypothetical protein